jgi:hypothetical protein
MDSGESPTVVKGNFTVYVQRTFPHNGLGCGNRRWMRSLAGDGVD